MWGVAGSDAEAAAGGGHESSTGRGSGKQHVAPQYLERRRHARRRKSCNGFVSGIRADIPGGTTNNINDELLANIVL